MSHWRVLCSDQRLQALHSCAQLNWLQILSGFSPQDSVSCQGAWCPAHFVDSRLPLQVSGHSWRKIEIRWWFVKLTMLGLIKDEKTNDSPFWLVSTRPSRLTFYWYRTFNRSDAPKLWSSCSSKMMMHPLVSWWATSTQAGKHTSQADGLTMRETDLCWLIMKKAQFDFPLRDQSSPKLTSAHLTYMQDWWEDNNPSPNLSQ